MNLFEKVAQKPKKMPKVYKLSLLSKIAIPFVILLVMIMGSLVAMNYTITVSDESQDVMSNNVMNCEKLIGEIRYQYTMGNKMFELAKYDLANAANYKTAMEEQFDLLDKSVDSYKSYALTDEERGYADDFKEAMKNIRAYREESFEYYLRGEVPTKEMMSSVDNNSEVLGLLQNMNDATDKDVKDIQVELKENSWAIRVSETGAVVGLFFAYFAAGYIVIYMVVKPIKKSSSELEQ